MKGRLLKLVVVVLFLAVAGIFSVSNVQAARCTVDGSGNVSCTNHSVTQWYWWGLAYIPRGVHWQVPEGTAPSGGWPVVYWFEGTSPTYDNYIFSPFVRNYADVFGDLFGLVNEAMTVRTLLDDVYGTGKKYAVIAPAPPLSTLLMQFWNTNCVFPYEISADYYFFNTLFPSVDSKNYGNVNNSRRYATGVSSGGYNTSRMAITFNGGSKFKALAVQSASYADCSGPACALPCSGTAYIPSNHPPTKFYHGVYDPIVPIATMRCYYNLLLAKGKSATKYEFTNDGILGLHGYSTGSYSSANGVQAYFNAHQ
jgi:hypothetical protein